MCLLCNTKWSFKYKISLLFVVEGLKIQFYTLVMHKNAVQTLRLFLLFVSLFGIKVCY
jgi:hypothetical protein